MTIVAFTRRNHSLSYFGWTIFETGFLSTSITNLSNESSARNTERERASGFFNKTIIVEIPFGKAAKMENKILSQSFHLYCIEFTGD